MKRHAFDPWSAVFGLLFAGIGIAFMSGGVDITRVDGRVVVAVVLLFVGLLIAGLIFRRTARVNEALSPEPEPDESP